MVMVMQGMYSALSKYKDMDTHRCYWTLLQNQF